MTYDYPRLVGNLSDEECIRFYEILANKMPWNYHSPYS